MKTNVAVVIPNWNGADFIADALTSLKSQTAKLHIIVVDNGSVDESISVIQKFGASVELIKLPKNTGFAGGVNRGIESAMAKDCTFVALLNNDAVADKHWLANLLEAAEQNPTAGIVASKMLRSGGAYLDSTGESLSIWGLPFPRGRNEKDTGQYDTKNAILAASGGASLYRVAMLKEVGLFDEDFFVYFEDVDISLRARLAGWEVIYEPTAIVEHQVSATASKLGTFTLKHSVKNFLLLYAKNMPLRLYIKYSPLFALQYLRWLITSTLRGKLFAFLAGTWAAVKLHPDTVVKRRQIQRHARLSTKDLDRLLYKHRPPRQPAMPKKGSAA